jgi:ribonuclease P protein component
VGLAGALRLKRRSDFLRVQQRGTRVFNGSVVVIALKNGLVCSRLGITASS